MLYVDEFIIFPALGRISAPRWRGDLRTFFDPPKFGVLAPVFRNTLLGGSGHFFVVIVLVVLIVIFILVILVAFTERFDYRYRDFYDSRTLRYFEFVLSKNSDDIISQGKVISRRFSLVEILISFSPHLLY